MTTQATTKGTLHKTDQSGPRVHLTFAHNTGTVFFADIDEAGRWIRKHGGELGRTTGEGASRQREVLFLKTNKLPKWAQP